METIIKSPSSTPYSNDFFDAQERGAFRSAQAVLPMVVNLFKCKSALDVGCGRGAWLRALQELGMEEIWGVDGAYVDRDRLLIPPERFRETDLSKPFELNSRYDLAMCLEVAEHLPKKTAESLVQTLAHAAPAVLFSAALPGQGGTYHINEQMPDYWRALFARHGFVLLDPIRPVILTNTQVDWWYRQNIVVYASEGLMHARPDLDLYRMPGSGPGIEWVQAHLLSNRLNLGVKGSLRQLISALGIATRRRFRLGAEPLRADGATDRTKTC